MTLLSVRSVRVMLLDVHMSLAAVLRDLSTVSRRPHLRGCLTRELWVTP